LQPATHTKINTEQSDCDRTEKSIPQDANKENKLKFNEESEGKKESIMAVNNHFTEWQGREKEKVFKNTTNMQEQFERVFNKKLGLSYPSKKR
jgi:hypothetical protein